jgi:hypothetical protein
MPPFPTSHFSYIKPPSQSDLAAVVAYARNDLSVSTVAGDKQCGIFIDLYEHTNIPTYASATTVCRNTAPNQQMQDFMNWYCGFCIVFDGTACQGVERWSGGPSPKGENDAHDVTGARSYFCY